jgi:hypothetical protein
VVKYLFLKGNLAVDEWFTAQPKEFFLNELKKLET